MTAGPTIGRYAIEKELGAGGFATVYQGFDPVLERPLAIKLLHPHLARDPEIRARFVREGRALARVRHPNIVQVFDAGEVDGTAFLAMELVPGITLESAAAGRAMPLTTVTDVVRMIAPALEAVHAAGLVHRDIKPANILVTFSPAGGLERTVLLDLGIARDTENTGVTSTGALLGTPAFLAPEQLEARFPVGVATDVYQLAATVYALLAGRPPFEGDTMRVLYNVVNSPPPPLRSVRPDLPEAVEAAIMAGLAKDPRGRPSSPIAFVQQFDISEVGRSNTPPASGTFPLPTQSRQITEPHRPPRMGAGDGTTGSATVAAPSLPSQGPLPPILRPANSASVKPLLALGGVALAVAMAGGGLLFARDRFGAGEAPDPAVTTVASATAPGLGTVLAGNQQTAVGNTTATTRLTVVAANASSTSAASPTATGAAPSTGTPALSVTPPAPGTPRPGGGIGLPTIPARELPVPERLGSPQRDVVQAINRNTTSFIAAVLEVDDAPLRRAFTGPALDEYIAYVKRLRDAGQYERAELVIISLTEFRMEGDTRAYAKTYEQWSNNRYERATNRKVSGTATVYTEEYFLVLQGGRWLVERNPNTIVVQSPN